MKVNILSQEIIDLFRKSLLAQLYPALPQADKAVPLYGEPALGPYQVKGDQ